METPPLTSPARARNNQAALGSWAGWLAIIAATSTEVSKKILSGNGAHPFLTYFFDQILGFPYRSAGHNQQIAFLTEGNLALYRDQGNLPPFDDEGKLVARLQAELLPYLLRNDHPAVAI